MRKYRGPYTVTCIEILHCKCNAKPAVSIDGKQFTIDCSSPTHTGAVSSTDFEDVVRLWNRENMGTTGGKR